MKELTEESKGSEEGLYLQHAIEKQEIRIVAWQACLINRSNKI